MMGIEHLEIKLPKTSYYAGETISGVCEVRISNDGPIYSHVDLTFKGYARVEIGEATRPEDQPVADVKTEFHKIFPATERKLTTSRGKNVF